MIVIPALLLLILGISVIFTSSANLAMQQLIFGLAGFVIYFFIGRIDYRLIRYINLPLYILVILALVVVFIIGFETRGSVRWIPLGIFNFQPSELAKIVLILVLADFWSKRETSWRNIIYSLGLFVPLFGLVFKQPDLGTALTLFFIWFSMLFAANLSYIKIIIVSIFGLISLPLGWFTLHDYQRQRLTSFLFPGEDPLGIGYNVIQSMIAVGSGGVFGRGLGRGTQSRLQFLPEFRTDFIFAFIAEELGLIGSLIVLGMYSLVLYLGFKILKHCNDMFGQLIAVGVLSMLFFQIFVNIGMNIGLLPITGITLPLLSYGGSSILTVFISLGIISSIKKFGISRHEQIY